MWSHVFSVEIKPDTFSAGDTELPWFLGQILHESAMLERLEESLSYTAERICQVWPSRFPTLADARPYARSPEVLANRVYGGRLGNTEPGDGWRYRGRGVLQVTGRANYLTVGRTIGMSLVGSPDMLAKPSVALRASLAWWNGTIPDAAIGNIKRVRRLVNGGAVGIDDCARLTNLAIRAVA